VRRVFTIARSRTGRVALVAGLAGATLLALAAPAYAHHPVLSGSTVCSDGVHIVNWTIGNSETAETMTIDSAVATLGGQTYPVTG
jgi:hypothetical protein